jgi:positive regulator of sigma E activity
MRCLLRTAIVFWILTLLFLILAVVAQRVLDGNQWTIFSMIFPILAAVAIAFSMPPFVFGLAKRKMAQDDVMVSFSGFWLLTSLWT